MAGTSPATPRDGAAGLYAAAGILVALAYFAAVLQATRWALLPAARATVLAVAPAAAYAYVVTRIGRRVRWFDGARGRAIALQAALGVAYTACWSATVVVLFAVERWLTVPGARFDLRADAMSWTIFTGILLYGGVAGAAFGLDTTARLRAERARAERAETLRVRAELAALRAQLNPHFLFNTLHTVLGLVRRDPALAEEALQDLGDVLRYALSVQRDGDQVELREELGFVDRYLAIERVRLGDRLRLERTVSDEALACRLPAFTVQPIVENAIRYAVACRAQGGRVRIAARRDGRDLAIEISDDGDAPSPQSGGAGLGLALVRQRLEAAFGVAATLVAEPTAAGFVVALRVPQPPVEARASARDATVAAESGS